MNVLPFEVKFKFCWKKMKGQGHICIKHLNHCSERIIFLNVPFFLCLKVKENYHIREIDRL